MSIVRWYELGRACDDVKDACDGGVSNVGKVRWITRIVGGGIVSRVTCCTCLWNSWDGGYVMMVEREVGWSSCPTYMILCDSFSFFPLIHRALYYFIVFPLVKISPI